MLAFVVVVAGAAAVAAAAALCNYSRWRTPATAWVCPADTSEQCWAAEWRLAAGTWRHRRRGKWSRVGRRLIDVHCHILANRVVYLYCCLLLSSGIWYGDGIGNTTEENYRIFSLSHWHWHFKPDSLVAVSKGMWGVKLCSDSKILQLLTEVSANVLSCIMAVKWLWWLIDQQHRW